MEVEKLKEIFREYDPDLSSSMAFLDRLDRNLDSVEMIHRENESVMKRNRIAVAAAACAGFMVGILFSFTLPYISELVRSLMNVIPGVSCQDISDVYPRMVSWIVVGVVSVFASISTYDISISLRPSRGGRREG